MNRILVCLLVVMYASSAVAQTTESVVERPRVIISSDFLPLLFGWASGQAEARVIAFRKVNPQVTQ